MLCIRYIHCRQRSFKLKVMNVNQQANGNDCGLYAIAFATSLLCGENPTELKYAPARSHFGTSVDKGVISSFPASLPYRKPNVLREMELEVYCTCRCPDDGKLMVECEGCAEWFHASSVG